MVKSYVAEIERLRGEVKDLLERRAADEDQYKSMTTENELWVSGLVWFLFVRTQGRDPGSCLCTSRLVAKLDGLEKDSQAKDEEIAMLRAQLTAVHHVQPSVGAKVTNSLQLSSVSGSIDGSLVPFDRRATGPSVPKHTDSFRIGSETPINAVLRGARIGSMFTIDPTLFTDWDGDVRLWWLLRWLFSCFGVEGSLCGPYHWQVERLKLALSVAMKRVAELQARLYETPVGGVKTLTTKKFSDLLQTSREVFSVRARMTKGAGGFFSSSMPGPALSAALHSMAEEEKKAYAPVDAISEITGPSSVCSEELREYANSYENDQFATDDEA
jgi:hypothetical protein